MNNYYKEIDLDCMSDNDVQSFFMFKKYIENLCKLHNESLRVHVIPVIMLNEEDKDVSAFLLSTVEHTICYNIKNMGTSKEEIMADASHEFLHLWFRCFYD